MITKMGLWKDEDGRDIIYTEENGKIYFVDSDGFNESAYKSMEELIDETSQSKHASFEVVYGTR